MKGLPAPCILLPVVVLEASFLDTLVSASALDEVVAALNAGSSVFLIGWLVGLSGFSPALGTLGGLFFCHAYRIAQTYKNARDFLENYFYFFTFLFLTSLRENCEIGMGKIVRIKIW
jgi:hypothetical protein